MNALFAFPYVTVNQNQTPSGHVRANWELGCVWPSERSQVDGWTPCGPARPGEQEAGVGGGGWDGTLPSPEALTPLQCDSAECLNLFQRPRHQQP